MKTKEQVGPELRPITSEYLDYDEVIRKYDVMMDWLAGLYVNTLNLIQYMHDKYFYEAAEMASLIPMCAGLSRQESQVSLM